MDLIFPATAAPTSSPPVTDLNGANQSRGPGCEDLRQLSGHWPAEAGKRSTGWRIIEYAADCSLESENLHASRHCSHRYAAAEAFSARPLSNGFWTNTALAVREDVVITML